jgi:hypothetical protein
MSALLAMYCNVVVIVPGVFSIKNRLSISSIPPFLFLICHSIFTYPGFCKETNIAGSYTIPCRKSYEILKVLSLEDLRSEGITISVYNIMFLSSNSLYMAVVVEGSSRTSAITAKTHEKFC